ncbi:MAG TPA: glycosyltransferase family 39 protein [Kofleriaceae bacterium]
MRLVRFASNHALLLTAVLFVVISVARIVGTAQSQGWTYDEHLHLGWSERFLEGISERWSNPGYDSKTPVSVPNAVFARFADAPETSLFLARLPMAAWFLLLAAGTFLLARRLGPPAAGPLAVILICLEPNLIAHSTVVTVDVPLAACTVLSALAFLAFWEHPSPRRGFWAGAALGATFATKFSAILLAAPLYVAAIVAVIVQRDRVPIRRGVVALGSCAVAALFVIAAAFGFQDMFSPLADIELSSQPFISLTQSAPWLRLPLPEAFLTGLDMCIAREREITWNVVVLGEHYSSGVWYYYLFHWAIKTPLALIAVTLVGAGVALRRRLWRRPHVVIIVAMLAVPLAYFSFIFRVQIGYRYTLMCVPLVLVLVATALAQIKRSRLAIAGFGAIVLLGVVENVPYWTNPLSFTNSTILDKKRAFEWTADSNLDWGHHDAAIERQVRARRIPAARVNPPHPLAGRNVFAVNAVAGVWEYEAHQWLRANIRPTDHIEHTHLVFDVTDDQFERMLVETRTLESQRPDCEVLDPISRPILLRDTNAAVCVEVRETAVIRLVAKRTRLVRHPHHVRVRVIERAPEVVGPGHELWYRMLPGRHLLRLDGTGKIIVRVESGRARAGELFTGS